MLRSALTALAIAVCFTSTVALSGEADVKKVTARKDGSNSYTFHVTVGHKDTGWDHHADKWDVVGPDGSVLDTRKLLHPHEHEQPFTRSLSGVEFPVTLPE